MDYKYHVRCYSKPKSAETSWTAHTWLCNAGITYVQTYRRERKQTPVASYLWYPFARHKTSRFKFSFVLLQTYTLLPRVHGFANFAFHSTNSALLHKSIKIKSSFQETKIWLAKHGEAVGVGRNGLSYTHRGSIDTSRQYFHTLLLRHCSSMQMKGIGTFAATQTSDLRPLPAPRSSNLSLVAKASYFVWQILSDTESTGVIMRKTCQIKRPPLAHSSFSERRE